MLSSRPAPGNVHTIPIMFKRTPRNKSRLHCSSFHHCCSCVLPFALGTFVWSMLCSVFHALVKSTRTEQSISKMLIFFALREEGKMFQCVIRRNSNCNECILPQSRCSIIFPRRLVGDSHWPRPKLWAFWPFFTRLSSQIAGEQAHGLAWLSLQQKHRRCFALMLHKSSNLAISTRKSHGISQETWTSPHGFKIIYNFQKTISFHAPSITICSAGVAAENRGRRLSINLLRGLRSNAKLVQRWC